jgi:non-heme chloroperoxidase
MMLKSPKNPGGTPIEVFDGLRKGVQDDRSQFFRDLSMPFYGYNRPGAKISEGVRGSFWPKGMMAGMPAAYFCIRASSETDMTEDLKKMDVPTLFIQGDDDQIVPIADASEIAVTLVPNGRLEVYKGAPRFVHDAQGPSQSRLAGVRAKRGSKPRLAVSCGSGRAAALPRALAL